MCWHLVAQMAVVGATRLSAYVMVGGDSEPLVRFQLSSNLRVISDMLRFRGNALKDWAKLMLSFGGTWLLLPWVMRKQPVFLGRSLLVLIPLVISISLFGIIDEMRVYSEAIPIVLTPILYAVAAELGGTRSDGENRES